MDDKLKVESVGKILEVFSNLGFSEQVEIFKTVQMELVKKRSGQAEEYNAQAAEFIKRSEEYHEQAKQVYAGNNVIQGDHALRPDDAVKSVQPDSTLGSMVRNY